MFSTKWVRTFLNRANMRRRKITTDDKVIPSDEEVERIMKIGQKIYNDFGHTKDTVINMDEMEGKENALYAAIDSLPEKCRVVFNLSRFEELSHKQIAEQLGISTKTIENQITKALKILREALIKHPNLSAIGIWMAYFYLWHRG